MSTAHGAPFVLRVCVFAFAWVSSRGCLVGTPPARYYVCKVYFTVEVGFCEVTLLGAPVGRARVDAQRARSTITHGRSRRGAGAGGTSEASAGGTN